MEYDVCFFLFCFFSCWKCVCFITVIWPLWQDKNFDIESYPSVCSFSKSKLSKLSPWVPYCDGRGRLSCQHLCWMVPDVCPSTLVVKIRQFAWNTPYFSVYIQNTDLRTHVYKAPHQSIYLDDDEIMESMLFINVDIIQSMLFSFLRMSDSNSVGYHLWKTNAGLNKSWVLKGDMALYTQVMTHSTYMYNCGMN